MDDELCKKMKAVDFVWADKDPNALSILESRIAAAGQNLQMIHFNTQLLRAVLWLALLK